ncbi:RDD family protein [Candidatus Microgenomates bacterium]|nr:RDD family protein [Candidatus Microgenomates bacterium]
MEESINQEPIVFHLASIWKRGVARLIDYILINLVIGLPLGWVMKVIGGETGLPSLQTGMPWFIGFFSYQSLIRSAINWIYEAYFLTTTGQTIGKRLLGIMVVSEKGKIIILNKALLRTTVGLIPLEFVLCFVTKRKQCLHDLLAQTVVVDK